MKTKSKISGSIIRGVAYAVFLAVAFIAASWAFNSPNKWYKSAVATVGYGSTAKSPSQPRAFSFAERVAYQQAIEDVYWRHRIWPRNGGENPDPKPALDAVMSQTQLENKVAGYLRDSLSLQDYWQGPSLLSNYSPRWTEWPGTQNNRKFCANCLRLLETIRLSSPSVWPDQY